MFRFAHPEYLYGLYSLPALVLLFWYLIRRRNRLLDGFAERKLQAVLMPTYSKAKAILRSGAFMASIAFLLLAAADPQMGTKIQNIKETGIDVYFLLDVSLSMQAQDTQPSRLEKAKFDISSLIHKLRGDRVGLIVFAGEPYIQFPLTSDYSAADLFLNAAGVNTVPVPGTAIASSIDLAIKSFDWSSKTEKVILLFSDGGDHQGDVDQAIADAKAKGIKIFTVGYGTTAGGPIPVYNDQGQQIGFKKDDQGNVVVTRLHTETLKEIASSTGGQFLAASDYGDVTGILSADLSKIRRSEIGEKRVTDYEDRFYYFLAPGILLLLIEFFMSERKSTLLDMVNRKLQLER